MSITGIFWGLIILACILNINLKNKSIKIGKIRCERCGDVGISHIKFFQLICKECQSSCWKREGELDEEELEKAKRENKIIIVYTLIFVAVTFISLIAGLYFLYQYQLDTIYMG